jgi:hypothetical protein
MPCDSSHLEATSVEREMSQVACLLDELDGKKINSQHWRGYHPRVYSQRVDCDKMVAKLCKRLQSVDVKDYSLEMQIWWRDHQAADKARVEAELAKAKDAKAKKAALAKLTPHEKKLLGIR